MGTGENTPKTAETGKTVGRGPGGRFLPGNAGGPGRRRKTGAAAWQELAGISGTDLWWVAKVAADREDWLGFMRKSLPAEAVARAERINALADAAAVELRRMAMRRKR